MTSIAVCINAYNEANAIGGAIESASQWADHITVYHTGPGGALSNDGTVEICEKWGVEQKYGSIDEGFGVVRTKMVTMCPTDWVAIMDADERIYRWAPRLACYGTQLYPQEHYPEIVDMDLRVEVLGVYDQVAALRALLRPEYDAIVTCRRHWQDFHWCRPSQNWQLIQDWQARILRCDPNIQYKSTVKMHEQLIDVRTGTTPRWYQPHPEQCLVFHDHFHLAIKRQEREQRAHDIAIYNALHEDRKVPTLEEFRGGLEPQGDVA